MRSATGSLPEGISTRSAWRASSSRGSAGANLRSRNRAWTSGGYQARRRVEPSHRCSGFTTAAMKL
ncbi:MAG TPA: hypothetical protein VFB81_05250, partial [Myxococcales bacterium]|nr:hypothetical protein [Myxococcales bacterium]